MMVGLLGAFAAMSLVPRRSLGWFTTMGTATMVIYLFHGFVIKTVKALGWPDFAASLPPLGLVLTILGAIALTLVLACPPVRRVLEPFTNPLGWLEARRDRTHGAAAGGLASGPLGPPSAPYGQRTPRRTAPPSAAPSPAPAPRAASEPLHPGGPGATWPAPRVAAGGAADPAAPPAATSADDRGPASTP